MDHLLFDYDCVRRLNPCVDGFRGAIKRLGGVSAWTGRPLSARQLAAAGTPLNDLIWLTAAAATRDADIERRVRLCCTDWAAHVAANRSIAPDAAKELLAFSGQTTMKAIALARAVVLGQKSVEDGRRVLAVFRPNRGLYGSAAGEAQWSAWGALCTAVYPAAYDSATQRSWDASYIPNLVAACAGYSVQYAIGVAAAEKERSWQLDRLCAWMDPDEPDLISLA